MTSLGFAYILTHIYRVQPLPDYVGALTLQFIDRLVRGIFFLVAGIGIFILGLLKLNQSLLQAFVGNRSVVDAIYKYRLRERGPRIVVIGGGTGLSVALRGLKTHTSNLTAIVTVADDGGSSGRLRRDMGVLPPGDFRNCMVALADVEPLMEDLFQYRFNNGSELEGHSFGNLFIVAMSEVTGNFEKALAESSRVLAVRGQVLPSTLSDVMLCAETDDEMTVQGESSISAAGHRIRRVYLEPDPPAYPAAIKAIEEADVIVVGPGSLYTSVLPNLVVCGIGKALIESSAVKIYVCNVATQPGETDGYGIDDHIDALLSHLGGRRNPFDYVLANSRLGLPMPASGRVKPVTPEADTFEGPGPKVVFDHVVDENNAVRHDSVRLAQAIVRLYEESGNGNRSWAKAKIGQYV
jgi:uncharacterized cofD-like protein